MPRISEFALFASPERNTLAIRRHCKSPAQFPAFIGSSFGQLGKYLSELDELMTDIPYVAYEHEPDGSFIVEAGFTVPRPLPGKGDINPGMIPEGKVVMCMYLGHMRPWSRSTWICGAGVMRGGFVRQAGCTSFISTGLTSRPSRF